ncbi:SRPBCC family protein [Rossellomorea sp. YZS02]|uniref:SRPBCC family protein n=1 Tax=Rossellomorea sp. YZS02 TaxID=3097358 RepID=UPI002A0EF015|nr:SRPBCC family protein [Rossellomorea sp. YZS02]MDX8345790.1 SRPBCC family protein [Rossellomorea sp. YZS02]
MDDAPNNTRIDTASRMISVPPQTVYRSFLNPEDLVSWLPPKGMSGEIEMFDPREGGSFKITLMYETEHSNPGKTTEETDVVQGTFLELVPDKKIVISVKFNSDDPAFSGEMIQKWLLEPNSGGTKVTIICENVPEGIKKEDHDIGLRSTLENLALYTE